MQQYQWATPPPTVEAWIQRRSRCEYCGVLPRPVPPPFAPARVARYLQAAALLAGAQMSVTEVARPTHGRAPRAAPGR